MIDITDIDKAALLAALYNTARPQGAGFLQYDPTPMTREQAEELVPKGDFDYLKGRVMKIDISGDSLDPHDYDRDNGAGTCQYVVDSVRAGAPVDDPELIDHHRDQARRTAKRARSQLGEHFSSDGRGGFRLGLGDLGEPLGEALDRADEALKK